MPAVILLLRRVALSLLILSRLPLGAENWPQWRGPAQNGISGETDLPLSWTTEKNIAWKLPVPDRSGATPIIWEDRIFLNVADGGNLELWCVARKDGAILWKKPVAAGNYKINKQNMSSPSPVTDGARVYVMTGVGIFKAFDFDGREIWTRDIQKDYGKFGLYWGYASSPLLHEDALYVQVLHGMKTDDPSYLLRIDKETGKTKWRVERPTDAVHESPDSYTTPALLENHGAKQIVITGGDYVTGHDPETGKELWRGGGFNTGKDQAYRIIASPVVYDGMIYAPTRVKPLIAFRAGGEGDITESHKVWLTSNGPDVPTPVTDGKYFYIVNDRGILWCLDAKTGEEVWGGKRIKPAIYSASPILADGRIYVTNEEGLTTVYRAGPKFEVLAENDFGEYTLSSPAVSDGRIFIRTAGHLYCIGEKQ